VKTLHCLNTQSHSFDFSADHNVNLVTSALWLALYCFPGFPISNIVAIMERPLRMLQAKGSNSLPFEQVAPRLLGD
jgi:hypothetical protein